MLFRSKEFLRQTFPELKIKAFQTHEVIEKVFVSGRKTRVVTPLLIVVDGELGNEVLMAMPSWKPGELLTAYDGNLVFSDSLDKSDKNSISHAISVAYRLLAIDGKNVSIDILADRHSLGSFINHPNSQPANCKYEFRDDCNGPISHGAHSV